jgi:O-antigen ligase
MRGNTHRQHNFPQGTSLVFFTFLCTLCFAPLAFGTTEIWSLATVELLTASAALYWFCRRKQSFYTIPGFYLLLCLLLLGGLQTLPLPQQLITFLSPHSTMLYQPFLLLNGQENWIPLTVHLKATVVELLRICSYVLFYCLTVQLLTNKTRLKITVTTVGILSALLAFCAILQKFVSPHRIYGIREIPASAWQGALGPWVNPNQYAGFMVMMCPLALALFFTLQPQGKKRIAAKERFLLLLSTPAGNLKLFLGFGIILIVSSLFLSHSRGGILSIIVSFICFFFCLNATSIKMRKQSFLFFTAALLFAAALFNWQPVVNKFSSTIDLQHQIIQDGRIMAWKDSLAIIGDFPLTGTGFGTFADSYPLYKSFTDIYVYDHAHNDYLELLTDGGMPAFLFFVWFMWIILKNGWQQLQKRRDPQAVLLTAGALSGVTGMLVYSCTDFNLHNGANGLYFFFLCALIIAAGHTRNHFTTRPTLLSPEKLAVKRKIILYTSGALLLASPFIMGGTMLAATEYEQAQKISGIMMPPYKKNNIITKLLRKAHCYDPLASRYTYALANLAYQRKNQELALRFYGQTMFRQPLEVRFIEKTANVLQISNPLKAKLLNKLARQQKQR